MSGSLLTGRLLVALANRLQLSMQPYPNGKVSSFISRQIKIFEMVQCDYLYNVEIIQMNV